MWKPWLNSATLAPIELPDTLRRPRNSVEWPGAAMNSRRAMLSLMSGALLTIATISPAFAEGSFEIPAGAHFNLQKLQRIGDYIREQIANGKIPGAILLIRQHDKTIYHEFFGVRDVATKLPMTDDTIFRLFSMSKPITSVAAMMLVDGGKLALADPVSKYIPAFADVQVGVERKAENGEKTLELAPPNRPIRIQDLMTHTSGITYGFYGDSMVRHLYRDANIYDGDFDNG
jgi:CubicO group peptidase (beta-lactamase class C family)